MARIVTDYLDNTVKQHPNKMAFADANRSITFQEMYDEAHHIATQLIQLGFKKRPILVYFEKSVEVIVSFSAISYSGNFYSPIDIRMPQERIQKIVEKLNPVAIITDTKHADDAKRIIGEGEVIIYEEALTNDIDYELIQKRVDSVIDSDLLYVLFTSGSTGTPKGVMISHKGIIDFAEWGTNCLGFDETTIFANQNPLYFSFSVYEIYITQKVGCSTYIVPEKLFTQPAKLMSYLDEKKINTITWVPSILTFLSTLNVLNRPHVDSLKNIFFGAEAFQVKHLNRWMDEYPDARFINLYGPTEVTDTCTWFEINRRFAEGDFLPIGKSCINKDCFLLDDDQLVEEPGILGELCMRGSGVAYGYYNDPERTNEVFTQNPLNKEYKEIIYRTGDLAKYNEYGEMVYVCRKDFQIKHRGRRIELGEIESAVSTIEGISENCCLYDNKKLRIVLFYTGDADGKKVIEKLKELLPEYMIPGKRVKLDTMPHNLNGKINRSELKMMIEKEND